ncbi:Endonuclease/exonuclease/phosphatase [Rhizoctonia solani]|nr:Endonuclease/exonuclease/phosphatase [Rhizoctonia solani]
MASTGFHNAEPVASLRLTTWNLRYDSQSNNLTVADSIASLPDRLKEPEPYYADASHEKPWSTRRIGVAALLRFQGSPIISFQEALVRQVRDLKELLGENWDWVGVGRDDGLESGEFSPIFFDKSVVQLKSWDTFWLTNTPFDVSKYPGAGSYRICTVAHLSAGGKDVTLLNTHFDDQSDAQRRLAASLILHRAKYEAATTKAPVFVNGDFNSPAEGTDNGAYEIFTGKLSPVPINATFAEKYAVPADSLLPENFGMIDTRGSTPREMVFGHFATYTGFSNPGNTSPYGRIDFVFGASHVKWQSVAYKADEALYDDGVYLSDHRPVTVDLILQ